MVAAGPLVPFDVEGSEVPYAPVPDDAQPGAEHFVEAPLPALEAFAALSQLDGVFVVLDQLDLAGVLVGDREEADSSWREWVPHGGAVDEALQDEHDPHVVPAAGVSDLLDLEPFFAARSDGLLGASPETEQATVEDLDELPPTWEHAIADPERGIDGEQVQLLAVAQ